MIENAGFARPEKRFAVMVKITFWSFSRHVEVNILLYYQLQQPSFFGKIYQGGKTMKPKKAFNKPVAAMVTVLLILGTGLQTAAAKYPPVGKVLR